MSAREHLNNVQFEHEKGPLEHSVYAFHPSFGNGEIPIGSMHWYHSPGSKFGHERKPGEISTVEVMPDYRRQGVASAMYEHAKGNYSPVPLHTSTDMTPQGKKWAKSVGGDYVG